MRAAIERKLAPGYSTCGRCNRPWKFVEGHSTQYAEGRGCFPLCEGCWQGLGTPEARLPYYAALWVEWERELPGHVEWQAIHDAVMAEVGS